MAAEIAIIGVVVVIAGVAWIFIHALAATGRISDVRDDIARVRLDLVEGHSAAADLAATQADARAAERDTHDPLWSATSWLAPVKTIRGITSTVDTLAQTALPDVVSVGPSLQPARLRVNRSTIALAPLRQAQPTLARAAAEAAVARDRIAALPRSWLSPVSDMRAKVLRQLTSLTGSADDANRFATVGPAMLGDHGLRRYFVAIQNNAESRSTGGLIAAWAIVTADHGTIRVAQRGNDSVFRDAPTPVVSLGKGYNEEYGNYDPTQRWITSNLSPNFPDAADIWAHLWQRQTGEHIDGVFGVDPYALQNLLLAVGPVIVRGYPGSYNAANLATFIESTEYSYFPGLDNPLRKDFVSKVAGAVLHKLLSGVGPARLIATELGRSAGAGHLALWSARPAEEAEISGTPLAGQLPETTAPFAAVHVDSALGGKLDYYLNRTLTYRATTCSGSTRTATITVALTNNAPLHGLPAYVRENGDTSVLRVDRVPRNRLFVFIHATQGAALLRATLDGVPIQVSSGLERGHPVYGTEVGIDPGATRTIRLTLDEPVAPGAPQTQVQPMARPQHTVLDAPTCA